MEFEVADLDLASEGKKKIEWTEREMPVVTNIASSWKDVLPLQN